MARTSAEAKPIRRFILWTIGYLATLGISLIVGSYVGSYVRHSAAFRQDAADPDLQAALLEYRVTSGDETAHCEALADYLEYLERRAPQSQRQFSSYFAADKALTLVRLATVTHRSGQTEQSRQFLDRALALCTEMKWAQCDEAQLSEGAAKLDNAWSDLGKPPR
jgi:hypothetical protein